MAKKELKFYDVKEKQSFYTNKYDTRVKTGNKGKRKFAVAKSPFNKGMECWRVLGKA